MASSLHNYLRTYRKRAGLSQAEVAFLLGCHSGAKISRYEHAARRPNLETVVAYEVILGAALHDLFAGLYHDVEKQTRKRAGILIRKLEATHHTDPLVLWKIAILETLHGGKGHQVQ